VPPGIAEAADSAASGFASIGSQEVGTHTAYEVDPTDRIEQVFYCR
jgi:hypothetical protein